MNFVEEWISWAVTSMVAALAGSISWLVRKVFTNAKQLELMELHHKGEIELLKTELHQRDQQRQEDRELIKGVKEDVAEVRQLLYRKFTDSD